MKPARKIRNGYLFCMTCHYHQEEEEDERCPFCRLPMMRICGCGAPMVSNRPGGCARCASRAAPLGSPLAGVQPK